MYFRWDPYPAEAYAALPQHSGMMSGMWRVSVPLICFDIVEMHLLERVMRQYGMVYGIPPPCDIEVELHLTSHKGQKPKNWIEINGRHIARWEQRLEVLAQGACSNQHWRRTYHNRLYVVLPLHHTSMDDTTRYPRCRKVRSRCTYNDRVCKYSSILFNLAYNFHNKDMY